MAGRECQRILLRWFDSGLIHLFADAWATTVDSGEIVRYEDNATWRSRVIEAGQHLILDHEDARALLGEPATRDSEGAAAGVMLSESETAAGLSFDDSFDVLAGLPENVIYDQ